MLNISTNKENEKLVMELEGRLDTTTAPQLEEVINTSLDGITSLVFDFEKLEYISSAGLRVMLSAQKMMNEKGTMKVIHVNDVIREIFEITAFNEILTIE
ncbi:MAG: STAS domain-containing protein [Solobacterium sp.]|nr:STAS domain-containing protein [Solobacterium sp.]